MDLHKLRLAASQYTKEKTYWLTKLAGVAGKNNFPGDKQQSNKEEEHTIHSFEFDNEISNQLDHLCAGSEYAMHVYLMAVIKVLLQKYVGRQDIVIGTPIYDQSESKEFINTVLPIRTAWKLEESFKDLAYKVRTSLMEANEHQNYPVELLAEEVDYAQKEEEQTLLDVVVVIKGIHNESHIDRVPHNIAFVFDLSKEFYTCTIRYNNARYTDAYIQQIEKYLKSLLSQVLTNPTIELNNIQLITQNEYDDILNNLGNGLMIPVTNHSFFERFEQISSQFPDRTAVSLDNQKVSYSEIINSAELIACKLENEAVKKGDIVPVLMNNSPDMIAAILAICKLGAVLLPISTEIPRSRVNYLLEDSQAKVVFSEMSFIDMLFDFKGTILTIESTEDIEFAVIPKSATIKPDDIAYIIYTSGTTGKPKGVMVSHKALNNYIDYANRNYFTESVNTIALFTSMSFDLSITSVLPPLTSGKTICIYNNADVSAKLLSIIEDDKTDFFKATPSHLQILVMQPGKFKNSKLKKVVVGGEQLYQKTADAFFDKFTHEIELINEYGPTETTVGCTTFTVKKNQPYNAVPIGKPIQNTSIYLLDKDRNPVPENFEGEIWIAGEGVSSGYLHQPSLTEKSFVASPFQKNQNMYASGDLAVWQNNGNLLFIGRSDNQIKVRGYRIEPAEVKNNILENTAVVDAEVFIKKDASGEPCLTAYIIYKDEPLTPFEWNNYLKTYLPEYMIPQFFIQVSEWPLTVNGKLDTAALPDINSVQNTAGEKPKGEIQKKLTSIWAVILGIDPKSISIDDDFFMLGGQSIKGIKMAAQIHKTFDVVVNLIEIFEKRTIREISLLVRKQQTAKFNKIEKAAVKPLYLATSAQLRFYSLQNRYPHSTAYNMLQTFYLKGKTTVANIEKALNALVQRHEILRTVFVEKDGKLYQKVLEEQPVLLQAEEVPESDWEQTLKEKTKPFNLNEGPLLRATVLSTGQAKTLLMVEIHHILIDGISQKILTEQFLKLYNGLELETTEIQYKDYSEWINFPEKQDHLVNSEKYWLEEFSMPVSKLNLPGLQPLEEGNLSESGFFNYGLDKDFTQAVQKTARNEGITPNVLILAAFFLTLSKITGQKDITIGVPSGGRAHPDLEDVVGLFLNTVVLRMEVNQNKSVKELFKQVNAKNLKAIVHQYYPFDFLVKKLNLSREKGANPLFDVVYSYNDADMFADDQQNVDFETNSVLKTTKIAKFDLTLHVILYDEMLELNFEYNTAALDRETVENYLFILMDVLKELTDNTQTFLKDINVTQSLSKATANTSEDSIDFAF